MTAIGAGEPSPPLEVTVRQQGRWTVLALAGELDYLTRDVLGPFLQQVTSAAGRPCVAVDMSALRFCDSAGITCVFNASRRIRGKGGELTVVDAGPLRLRHKPWMRGLGGAPPRRHRTPRLISHADTTPMKPAARSRPTAR